MKKNLIILAIASLLLFGVAGVQADETKTASLGEKAPNFTLKDSDGKTHSLTDFKGKFVVLEWINYDCPFVKKHYSVGNMQKLQTTYTGKDVVWLAICSSAPGNQGYFESEKLQKEIKAHESKASAYLIDADGTVGNLYEAKTTPNMYIINPEGVLIYAGAIDDKPSVNSEDIKSSTNYVAEALEQVMSGKPVSVKATQPYGCSVKYAKK